MSILASGQTSALTIEGIGEIDDAAAAVQGFRVKFHVRLLGSITQLQQQVLSDGIRASFNVLFADRSPEFDGFAIYRGSVILEWVFAFNGAALLGFIHQYKQVRSGIILMANDARCLIEWSARRLSKQPEKANNAIPAKKARKKPARLAITHDRHQPDDVPMRLAAPIADGHLAIVPDTTDVKEVSRQSGRTVRSAVKRRSVAGGQS